MSDLTAATIESVLAEHRFGDVSYIGTGHGTMGRGQVWCRCKAVVEFDWYESDASDAHRSHVAAAISARLAAPRDQTEADDV